jgi:predicted dehydrogenase
MTPTVSKDTPRAPLRIGIAGIGGYATSIADFCLGAMRQKPPLVRLAHVCDPHPTAHPARLEVFQAAGVSVHESYDAMLDQPLDAVWLPVPIHLHRPFAEKAIARGLAVMCEKPPAGTIDDFDAMTAAAEQARQTLLFGYQDVYDPAMLMLKRRILSGELGEIKSVTITACWPRDSKYYGRNDWAGRLKRGESWVLDSPMMNALAHPINLCLFLMGTSEQTSAPVTHISGELYRANPIENFDTVSCRAMLPGNVPMLICLTHAAEENFGPDVLIVGTKGSASFDFNDITIKFPARQIEVIHRQRDLRVHMVNQLARYQANQPLIGAVATPAIARPHLVLCNALSQNVKVHEVPESFIVQKTVASGGTQRAIRNIEALVRLCAREGQMFSESGQAPWSTGAHNIRVNGYSTFAGAAK